MEPSDTVKRRNG